MDKVSFDFLVGSLNIRGMNEKLKRLAIFNWIKNKKMDIFMLQECYCMEETRSKWEQEWGGKCLFSHGSKHSKGTIILFRPCLDVNILSTTIDTTGRYIITRVEIQGENFVLANIYAPNKPHEKGNFFEKILNVFETMDVTLTERLIIGGDWNCIQDINRDKKGGNKNITETIPKQLSELMSHYNLIDIWRLLNPKVDRYTFRQKTPLIQTRLDYFLISNNLQDFIVNTNILPSIRSDHSIITMHVKHISEQARGNSHWKFNSSLINDQAYITNLQQMIASWKQEYSSIEDKRVLWDLIKYEIRKYTMAYCAQKKKHENKIANDLEEELVNVNIEMSQNPSQALQNRYDTIKHQIKQIEDKKIKGEIIRSKVQWAEEGERSSKYFFGLEKHNYVKKHMRKLEIEKIIITDPKKIQYHQQKFYKSLYQSKQENNYLIPDTFLNSNTIPVITETEKNDCDQPITLLELEKALLTFKNDKSPGNDGLSYEFYKQFWNIIKQPLLDCFLYSFDKDELSNSQKQSLITLLEKPGKNRMHLENWRPISLLNFDYKILTKLLSYRIQKYLPKLIHPNQSGFVKGRFIGDAVRIIQDMLEFTNKKDIPGLLLFIDFEKAFDTIEWNFIWKAFERYNFGNSFIKWLKILYTNPLSCILNNGFSGPYFKLERGVRQGDPLSPYIFILSIELLAIKIRADKDIIGFNLNNTEFKLCLYADDMTVAVQDINSASKVLDLLKIFSSHSGLNVNKTKTEGMWMGKDKNNNEQPFGIKWPKTPIKVLGIYHSYNKEAAISKNFDDKIESLLKMLHWWKARNLSLTGKILIVKALGLSKFSLLSSLVSVPQAVVSKINTAIYNFIWNGKTDKVKRTLLEQEYEDGGLKMLDFGTMVKGAKVKWIKRYLSCEDMTWKVMFEKFCCKVNLNVFLRSNFDINELPETIPRYYAESIGYWHELKIKNVEEFEPFLWYNKNIKIGNKSIYSSRLFAMGIWKVSDLYHENKLIKFETLLARGALQGDYIIWRGIITATSNYTRHINNENIKIDLGLFQCGISKKILRLDEATEKQIKSGIKYKALKNMKTKDFKARIKFDDIHGEIDLKTWASIYALPWSLNVDNFTRDLQYKILYRFIPTNKLLYKMNKIHSNFCSLCNLQIDTIEHALWNCLNIRNFWHATFDLWNATCHSTFQPNLQNITFGVVNEDLPSVNTLILHGKTFIQKAKQFSIDLSTNNFIDHLKRVIFKMDPCTENIIHFINTLYPDFTV